MSVLSNTNLLLRRNFTPLQHIQVTISQRLQTKNSLQHY